MALVWAWGRIPSRHGPAKKPAGQRKQGEANRGGGRESKNLWSFERATGDVASENSWF
ncbi:BQ5605_C029g10622 [Microbotryum silenes-dioicae]|uniref:BQ5605_C001g00458 protein n=1 Tax=Microbotryum silenes-dioicae TaxID=796604 RepID=A0A2X0M7E4_9BASI|nr:BQ5605_C001g00458 [Microbotryum silenes-dioicae]SGZ14839.1 BQ5605_C029g10622 [Microbotryum silenes-dioicae]